ncbi:MAG: hypothetical protein BA871_03845 [Desulfuromonadales bacterium C00003096]|jgi:hypothetical protein|nr:MAG: hypothetical protein BA871_03845 [Desulfuromonadales bacterium C00003096]
MVVLIFLCPLELVNIWDIVPGFKQMLWKGRSEGSKFWTMLTIFLKAHQKYLSSMPRPTAIISQWFSIKTQKAQRA